MFNFLKRKLIGSSYVSLSSDIVQSYNSYRPMGEKPLLCYVPFSSLTFSWQGNIYACTYNRQILIGKYPQNSIRSIWFGNALQKLRTHIEHNDLNYGCQHCKYFIERGKYSGLKPLSFDKYADSENLHYPKVMEFEISNKCNLECIMCNGHTSSAIRQNRDKLPPLPMPYDSAFVDQLREFIPHLEEAKFYGGEPFLISVYYQIMEIIMELKPDINIFVITNATVLTDKVKSLLERGNFNLAVSIDSLQKNKYEYIRKNASFEQVMSNLMYFNNYSISRGKLLSLSFTTQKDNWRELPEIVTFCNANNMVFFNSFLKEPIELSLIHMHSIKLKEVVDYLLSFDLPENTDIEKKNKKVYADYIVYIERYYKQNFNAEEKGREIVSDAPMTDSPLVD